MLNPINADATSVISNEEKQYDFSKLNKFLNEIILPVEFVDFLNQIRANYLELYLWALSKEGEMEFQFQTKDVLYHSYYIFSIIEIFKNFEDGNNC